MSHAVTSGTPGTSDASWRLTRRCAMAPRTLLWNVAGFGLAMFALGAGFWLVGYPWVMFFCACQAVAFTVAAFCYAVHATDGERVSIEGDRVHVEATCGRSLHRHEFSAYWLRVDLCVSGALTLRSGTKKVVVGRQLTEAQRLAFAAEFTARIARRKGSYSVSAPQARPLLLKVKEPSMSTSKLTTAQLETLAHKLDAREAELQQEVRAVKAESTQSPTQQTPQRVGDAGDQGEESIRSALRHAEVSRDIEELRQIAAARDRMTAGTYGLCIDCGTAVALGRLQALPSAERCMPCQETFEAAHPTGPRISPSL